MKITLPKLDVERKSGEEHFREDGSRLDFNLLDFWQWSMSDLVNNTIRGVLAEYIVAQALGASTDEARDVWAPYDLVTPSRVRVEVKSSSYLQSWAQSALSSISFDISPSHAWDDETGEFDDEYKRQADVYVFVLLAHQDKPTIDPMNLDQWKFYVLTTAALNEHVKDQKTLTLGGLENYVSAVGFRKLEAAVSQAMAKPVDAAIQSGASV